MTIDDLLSRLAAEARQLASAPLPVRSPWPPAKPALPSHGMLRLWAQHVPVGTDWLRLPPTQLVVAAYWLWLGRQPDAAGEAHALNALANGMPKAEWLLRLRLSDEAVARLGWPWWRRLAGVWLRLQGLAGQRVRRWQWGGLRRWERRLNLRPPRSTALLWLAGQDAFLSMNERLQQQHLDLEQQHSDLQHLHDGLQRRFDSQQLYAQADALAFLSALEQRFRGDPKALADQMAADYGALVTATVQALGGPCLDVGCGRGTWLAWLRDQGVQAQGADLSPDAAAEAQALGLPVVCLDGLTWLAEQPDASAGVVTAFHVVEHLTLPQRLHLVREAFRVLKPGGLLILETPNPENIWVATHTFYHDPTHKQPLTPDGLAFLCTYHGFAPPEVLRLHPYPDQARLPEVDAVTSRLNNMTCCGQDLAVVATKPLLATTAGPMA